MDKSQTYDLEERTFNFAHNVRLLARKIPKKICNIDDIKQLIRASGSVGVNYIEANEAVSQKDLNFRIKICRKESKEAHYWLNLLHLKNKTELQDKRDKLVKESTELLKIFSSILANSKQN